MHMEARFNEDSVFGTIREQTPNASGIECRGAIEHQQASVVHRADRREDVRQCRFERGVRLAVGEQLAEPQRNEKLVRDHDGRSVALRVERRELKRTRQSRDRRVEPARTLVVADGVVPAFKLPKCSAYCRVNSAPRKNICAE